MAPVDDLITDLTIAFEAQPKTVADSVTGIANAIDAYVDDYFDEIITTTPTPDAVPKAYGTGKIDIGWLPDMSGEYVPVSALASYQLLSEKDKADGYVGLDASKRATADGITVGMAPGGKVAAHIEVPALTTNSQIKIGPLEAQGYSVSSSWYGLNCYNDGSNFRRRSDGYAGIWDFFVDSGNLLMQSQVATTGSAGSVIGSWITPWQASTEGYTYHNGNALFGATYSSGIKPQKPIHVTQSGEAAMVFTNDTSGHGAGVGFFVGLNNAQHNCTLWSYGGYLRFGAGGTETMRLWDTGEVELPLETASRILGIDSSNYIDTGMHSLAEVDAHLDSTANPHTVTAAQASAVALTGAEVVAGVKTFSSSPIVPTPTGGTDAANKDYVDSATAPVDSVFGRTGAVVATADDYTAAQVDWDAYTADTLVGLDGAKDPESVAYSATPAADTIPVADGSGLLDGWITAGLTNPMTAVGSVIGGGASGTPTEVLGNTVADNRFMRSVGDGADSALPSFEQIAAADVSGLGAPATAAFGASAGDVCEGDDARLSDDRTPTAHGPTHDAGGSDAMAIDADAGTGSLRTLGTSATSACAGNDSRLSDARTPTIHASTHDAGGADAMAIDAAAGTGSLRTLGTSATSACAGNDSRLSDDRMPTAHGATHDAGGADALAIDAAAGTGSLRTLGTSATSACAGNDSRLSDDRTPSAHALVGALHTASGLTTGHFLKAAGATTYGFASHGLTYSDVGAAASGHDHDADYAAIADGVTNGDSHDHSGGDGAQIDHGGLAGIGDDDHSQYHNDSRANTWFATKDVASLSGKSHTDLDDIGSNTHAQIDSFILSKAAASGLASLDGSSLVAQNPANATATPAASKIPIADGSGLLDGWVTPSLTNPMTTLGDVIYGGASGTPTRLAANGTGTAMYLRQISGAAPVWLQMPVGELLWSGLGNTKIAATDGAGALTALDYSSTWGANIVPRADAGGRIDKFVTNNAQTVPQWIARDSGTGAEFGFDFENSYAMRFAVVGSSYDWVMNNSDGYFETTGLRASGVNLPTLDASEILALDSSNDVVTLAYSTTGAADSVSLADGSGYHQVTRLGVGTAASTYPLTVNGDISSSAFVRCNQVLASTSDSSGYAGEFFNDGNDNLRYGIKIQCGEDSPSLNNDCNWALLFDGDGTFTSSISYSAASPYATFSASDRRVKENIKDSSVDALHIICGLRAREWDWRGPFKKRGSTKLGFVAQEAEKVFPELVGETPEIEGEKYLSISQVPDTYLVRAIQQLEARVAFLESELETSRRKNVRVG